MINLTVITVFMLVILVLLALMEKIFKKIKLSKYDDNWFKTVSNDHAYLNRQDAIKRIMEDMR